MPDRTLTKMSSATEEERLETVSGMYIIKGLVNVKGNGEDYLQYLLNQKPKEVRGFNNS